MGTSKTTRRVAKAPVATGETVAVVDVLAPYRPAARKLAPKDVRVCRADVLLAQHNLREGAARLLAERSFFDADKGAPKVDWQALAALPALAAALGVGALIGLANGIGVTALGIPPLVMTLGMTGIVQGLVLVVTQGQLVGKAPPFLSQYVSSPLVGPLPGIVFIWALVGVGMWLLLERTRYGKELFGVGVNRVTSHLSGVRVPWVVVATYTLSGVLSAFGGVMLLGFTQNVFLNLGSPFLFPSVAAVVVGGTMLAGGKGSYWGTMAGALVLTLLTSLLTASQLPEAIRQMILGVTLLVLITAYGRQRSLRQ